MSVTPPVPEAPSFTAVIVATLALAPAANAAIFAVAAAISQAGSAGAHNTYPAWESRRAAMDFYEDSGSLTGGLAISAGRVDRGDGWSESNVSQPAALAAALIGTQPFLAAAARRRREPGGAQGAFTHGYWQRAFAGRNTAVGDSCERRRVHVVGALGGWRFIDPDLQVVIPAAFTHRSARLTGDIATITGNRSVCW